MRSTIRRLNQSARQVPGYATALLLALLVASPTLLAEQFYKWQDEQGVWHYSAQPPKGQPADKLKVRTQAGRSGDESEEGEEGAAKPKTKPGAETPESANCEAAKKNLEVLNSNQTVLKDTDGDGEPEELDLDQHQAEIATAERQIAAFCKPEPAPAAAEEAETE